MNKKVAQIGTFDLENFGDLLFPTVLKEVMRKHQIDVDLFSPYGGPMPFEEETFVHPIMNLENRILSEHYSAIVIGGGDLIRIDSFIAQDYEKTINNSLLLWQWPIILAKKYGIPVVFNAPGVPFQFKEHNQRIVKYLIDNVDYVSIRDHTSEQILMDCGINDVAVVPDTVFYINKIFSTYKLDHIYQKLIKNGTIPNLEKYVIFQHNDSMEDNITYRDNLRKTIKNLQLKENNLLFMPIGYVHKDKGFMNNIYSGESANQFFVKNKLTPIEMLSVISHSSGYIGTSMHGAVTSYAFKKPVALINPLKLTKLYGVSEMIGLSDVCTTDPELLPSIINSNFFTQKNSIKEVIDTQIENHFERIVSIISERRNEPQEDFECKLLANCQDKAYIHNPISRYAKIYYDRGQGFSESNIEIFAFSAETNTIDLNLEFDNDVQNIRLDPIENEIIAISNISIRSETKELPYQVDDLINIENKHIILSFDPKISFPLDEYKKVNLKMTFSILSGFEKERVLKHIYDQEKMAVANYNKLQTEVNGINNRKIIKIANALSKFRK